MLAPPRPPSPPPVLDSQCKTDSQVLLVRHCKFVHVKIKRPTKIDCLGVNTFIISLNKVFFDESLAPSKINHTSDNQTVNQNDKVHLNCTADGHPAPTIFWTRLSNHSNVSMPLNVRGMKDQGGYRCTANNGVGDPDTADVFITVQSKSNSFLVWKLEKSLGVEFPQGNCTAHRALDRNVGSRWFVGSIGPFFRVLK